MSWGRGEERIAGRGLGVRCGGGLSPGLPKQTQAQTYKLPKPDAGTPTSPLPPSPQTSAALAAAEPGLMANVLAPSEQDQCLGRQCGQNPACTLQPHASITVVPWGLGTVGTLGLAGGGGWGPHCLSWLPSPDAWPEQCQKGQEWQSQSLQAQVRLKQPQRRDLKSLHSQQPPGILS